MVEYVVEIKNSFMSAHTSTGPFGQPLHISTHGPMAFAPSMHGTFNTSFGTQPSFFSEPSFVEMSEESARKIAALQAKLDKKLGPEYISQRPGPGGGPKLTYAEGWKIINLANEVARFGFNGWSSNVVSITTDFVDYSEETRRFNVGVTAIVRVTLRDGVFHEDVGYGLLENSKSKGAALDKCKKEAVTDAVKRTLRNFGNLLGNCLYDKSYTQEVVKIKVPPPKFDKSDLHRRPEFEETKPNVSSATTTSSICGGNTGSSMAAAGPANPIVKTETAFTMPPPPHIPSHSTNHANSPDVHLNGGLKARPNAMSTPNAREKAPAPSHGLHTPVQTPTVRSAHGIGGDRMAQNVADRHAARLKQIQEAQEAQRREDEAARLARGSATVGGEARVTDDRRVSFAAEARDPASTHSDVGPHTTVGHSAASSSTGAQPQPRVSPPQVIASRSNDLVPEAESDEYHFPSEDDAYLASLDLDALDEGIGRPIDFDEGAKPDVDGSVDVSMSDVSNSSVNVSLVQSGRTHSEQRGSTTASSSRLGAIANALAPPAQQGQSTSGVSGERPQTPSMGGGFSFASRTEGNQRNAQSRSSANANGHPTASSGALKRTADIMQGISSVQQRRPAQGMGLQHPPGGGTHTGQSAGVSVKREPLATLETVDSGSVKRPRR
ncbi:hypothetical protein ACG7TL_009143 [Trametes sanguinea]